MELAEAHIDDAGHPARTSPTWKSSPSPRNAPP
jgi:hypothetical protein